MLKFFRKIRQKLLGEGKIKNYSLYAIGEITLIVVGILIALQIGNWNENLKTRKNEIITLKSIRQEMINNQSQLIYAISSHQNALDAGYKILSLFNTDISNLSQDTLNSIFYYALYNWTFDPTLGMLKSAISSGQVNDIQNQELKALLSAFEDTVYDTNESTVGVDQVKYNRIHPIMDKYISYIDQWHLHYPNTRIKNSNFESEFDKIFQNRELENTFGIMLAWRENGLEEEEDLLKSIEKIIKIIDKELN